jgi:hypothetical protein
MGREYEKETEREREEAADEATTTRFVVGRKY